MGIPWAFVKAMNGEKISEQFTAEEDKKYRPAEKMEMLQKDDRMKGHYLGACLDSCRWGSMTTVMWETSIDGMIDFVSNWFEQNKDSDIPTLFHEITDKDFNGKKWNLPYLIREKCPRDENHTKKEMDLYGRIRCAEVSTKKLKSEDRFFEGYSYFDELSLTKKLNLYNSNPALEPSDWEDEDGTLIPPEDYEIEEYNRITEEYKNSPKDLIVKDRCSAIISDERTSYSLEDVLRAVRYEGEPEVVTKHCGGRRFDFGAKCKRLNELSPEDREYSEINGCQGHKIKTPQYTTPMDGWELALYVKAWFEQAPREELLWKSPKFFTGATTRTFNLEGEIIFSGH